MVMGRPALSPLPNAWRLMAATIPERAPGFQPSTGTGVSVTAVEPDALPPGSGPATPVQSNESILRARGGADRACRLIPDGQEQLSWA
jgi:hypothetical protein